MEENDPGLLILDDIRTIFRQQGQPRLHTVVLVRELTSLEGRPWPEYSHGHPLSAKGLASLVRKFDIAPEKIPWRDGGGDSARGYTRATFEPAWDRYLSTPETSVRSVTVRHPSQVDDSPSASGTMTSAAASGPATDATDTPVGEAQMTLEPHLRRGPP